MVVSMLKGRFTFHSGGGYDVIDMDLLDGNGNGERSHILDREYNVYVSREYKQSIFDIKVSVST